MAARRLSAKVKTAIVAERAAGAAVQDICQKYGIHRNSVRRLVNDVKRAVPESALAADWRSDLQNIVPDLSVKAIKRSLEDTVDVHKAANTGVASLKGLGIFNPEQAPISILQLVQNMPAELVAMMERERRDGLPPSDNENPG